jgi:hypothetical protein
MVAQLPRGHPELDTAPDLRLARLAEPAEAFEPGEAFEPAEPVARAGLSELRAVAAALLVRMTDLCERDRPLPDAVFRTAERLQPLLDGQDPESEDELDELWELALALPRLLVRDGVQDIEPRGA